MYGLIRGGSLMLEVRTQFNHYTRLHKKNILLKKNKVDI